MMMSFELFEVGSGNLIGSYATEDQARAIVARAYAADGRDGVSGLILIQVRGDDQVLLGEGEELLPAATAATDASSATA